MYVAGLLDMKNEEFAELSYRNAVRLFSYSGSKLLLERGKSLLLVFLFSSLFGHRTSV